MGKSLTHTIALLLSTNLFVDVALIRQRVMHKDFRLYHIQGICNAADGLTKSENTAQGALLRFLDTFEVSAQGSAEFAPNYWIEEQRATSQEEYLAWYIRWEVQKAEERTFSVLPPREGKKKLKKTALLGKDHTLVRDEFEEWLDWTDSAG